MTEKICSALFDSDLIATRLTLAVAETLWAVMLLWPGSTFDRPTYSIMSAVLTEDAWGAIFALTACGQVAVVMHGRFLALKARAFAAWNALLWMFVVAAILLSVQPPPAAISGDIALAAAALWVWVRPMILASWYRRSYGAAHVG